jgi:hypothetical protein
MIMRDSFQRPWEADPEGIYDLQAALRVWNDFADSFGLPQVQRLTQSHEAKLRDRLRDTCGITGWASVLNKIRESRFLLGDNEEGWRVNLNFVLQEGLFSKLKQGAFSNLRGCSHE